ncbi:MAG: response regulator [Dehalococcoidia bacterium]
MTSGARLLVVDDEVPMLRLLRRNLEARGYQVDTAEMGREVEVQIAVRHPDLVLLDLNLPDMDGVAVIRAVRAHSSLPIIVLSARDEERDRVAALDAGADDYVSKPFGIEELLARVRVALRHAAQPSAGAGAQWSSGELAVDLDRRRVSVGGAEVHLTPTEYALLKVFVTHRDRVLTDRMLLREVWGAEYGDESHYLHVYVARLRKKIEPDPQRPRHLLTEPGIGYRLVEADQPTG